MTRFLSGINPKELFLFVCVWQGEFVCYLDASIGWLWISSFDSFLNYWSLMSGSSLKYYSLITIIVLWFPFLCLFILHCIESCCSVLVIHKEMEFGLKLITIYKSQNICKPRFKKSWNQSESTYKCVYFILCRKNEKTWYVIWMCCKSKAINKAWYLIFNRGRMFFLSNLLLRPLLLKRLHFNKKRNFVTCLIWFSSLSSIMLEF